MLVFCGGRKTGEPEKTLQSKAKTNNKLNHQVTPGSGFEPDPRHWWRRAVSPLRHPCSSSPFIRHRPLQKREKTGKEYDCFPFVWKTKIFKWKIDYILESLPRTEVFGGGKWQNCSSTNITQNKEFVWIGWTGQKLIRVCMEFCNFCKVPIWTIFDRKLLNLVG